MKDAEYSEALKWVYKNARPGPSGFLRVSTRSYVMPNGDLADWDILEGSRTVAVMAITTSGDILLNRMFRPGPGKVMLELPGGNVEAHEDIETAACRELFEETGYVPEHAEIAGQTWLASYATHQRFAVVATGCSRPPRSSHSPIRADQLEFAATTLVSMHDFRLHVATGQLTDTDLAFMCLHHFCGRPGVLPVDAGDATPAPGQAPRKRGRLTHGSPHELRR